MAYSGWARVVYGLHRRRDKVRFINKSSIIGFMVGAIVSPVIIIGGLYLYIQHELADPTKPDLAPPHIPSSEAVALDWNVRGLDETTINLEHSFKDKVLFLNFWATWCPPCVGEMQSIENLYRQFDKRVGFVCISKEEIETIKAFREKKGYTFPMYHVDGQVPEEFRTDGIPATFIISKEGKILLKHVGGADWSHESVVNFLEETLKGST